MLDVNFLRYTGVSSTVYPALSSEAASLAAAVFRAAHPERLTGR